jgi:hypothetical protein
MIDTDEQNRSEDKPENIRDLVDLDSGTGCFSDKTFEEAS